MKKEYFWAGLIAAGVILLANLSFITPTLFPKSGLVFLGRHTINFDDTYAPIAFIEQARQGRFFFENLFTSEPQNQNLFRPSYILIGNVARIIGLSSVATYHLFEVIFSITFCIALYAFLTKIFDSQGKRLTAFSIILTASGLGFAFSHFLPSSIDLWVPEAFPFLSFSEAPHFILSFTLLITGFFFFIKYLESKSESSLLLMFFSFFCLSFEHPYDLAVAVPVIFTVCLWQKIPWYKAFGTAFFSGIGLIYQASETFNNPILAAWNAQNILPSPSPINYISGLGLILIPAVIGLEVYAKEVKIEQKLLITWLAVMAILIYIPVNFQRRFIEGAEIPIGILATVGIYDLISVKEFFAKRKSLIIYGSILILSIGSIYSVVRDFNNFAADSIMSSYYYILPADLNAIKWLGTQTGTNDVILSNRYFGNLIPGIIGRKVFLGHEIQTINMDKKISETNSFLLEKNQVKAREFLMHNHITYIFLGVNDSITAYGFNPTGLNFLTKIYNKDGVAIYRVN